MHTRSPFPGMDPYLQRFWRDVHTSLVTYARDQLQDQLVPELVARMEERVYVEDPLAPSGAVHPDVYVVEQAPAGARTISRRGGAAVAEPLLLHLDPIELTEAFIQIIDAESGGKVVTVIEFLSPSNKISGEGRRKYLAKQRQIRRSRTNLVEIDLVRGGGLATLVRNSSIPLEHHAAYHACIYRGATSKVIEYYPLPLRQTLPNLRIPLRAKDKDVVLQLQPLLDLAYEKGRYGGIDYRRPLNPPLSPDDEKWAVEVTKSRRKKTA